MINETPDSTVHETISEPAGYWQAVLHRDQSYDDVFVYAVKSTGIYCRPTCPSRRPKRDQVDFFETPEDARIAGYRACKRCQPDDVQEQLQVVQAICAYLDTVDSRPTLAALAERFHYSPFHLQRVFKRITGVSPRQYFDSRRVERLKASLRDCERVTDAIYEAGYESISQVYTGGLGMTPSEYQKGGAEQVIRYALLPCAMGVLLVAATGRGLCAVRLADGDDADRLLSELRVEYPQALLSAIQPHDDHDPEFIGWVQVVYAVLQSETQSLQHYSALNALPMDVRATAFQRRVWEALRDIPVGDTRSYAEIATAIGQPESVRAVARAISTNPLAVVIPCHRVIKSDGQISGYRWGVERKQKLLELEGAFEPVSIQQKLL